LLTDGRIVYLTPLSKSGQCKSSAFVDACAKLSEKSHDTSLQNISNIAKLNKSDSLNRKDEDEGDE